MVSAEISLPTWEDESSVPGTDVCAVRTTPSAAAWRRTQHLMERLAALSLLLLFMPLLAMLWLAIRLSSPGPAVFRQQRVGLGGRIFTMYKFRSMRCDAERQTGPVWSCPGNDSRVTPLGNWLRRLHLDELPQLYNVVRGEMSLVGPRPERPEFVRVLARRIPRYLERLAVRPGITGLAQLNLPPDTDLHSVCRKLLLDLEYISTASWLLDARILGCTALRLLGLNGGRSVALFGLTRAADLWPGDLALPSETPTCAAAVDEECAAPVPAGRV